MIEQKEEYLGCSSGTFLWEGRESLLQVKENLQETNSASSTAWTQLRPSRRNPRSLSPGTGISIESHTSSQGKIINNIKICFWRVLKEVFSKPPSPRKAKQSFGNIMVASFPGSFLSDQNRRQCEGELQWQEAPSVHGRPSHAARPLVNGSAVIPATHNGCLRHF